MKTCRSLAASLMASMLALCPALAMAQQTLTITDDNSRFVLEYNDPLPGLGSIAIESDWFVDGRRIHTYVGSPAWQINVEPHHHTDSHVADNQIHAAGRLYYDSNITGGIVYTVDGGAAGSGASRLVEFVEISLASSAPPTPLHLTGFGFEPRPHGSTPPEMPDYTGLLVTGTTMAFATQGSFVLGGAYRDLSVLPFHSFTGFNTFSQDITLNPGTTLRMITELNVSRAAAPVPAIPEPSTWLMLGAGLFVVRYIARRRSR